MAIPKTTAPVIDPLAGIPTATAKPAPATLPVPAPAVAPVINFKAAKKRKLSGQAYKDAVKFARDMVGYDDTSPVWGRRTLDVLNDIELFLNEVDRAINASDYSDAQVAGVAANLLVTELKKRIAAGQIVKAQS